MGTSCQRVLQNSIGGDHELLADLPDILERVRFSTDEISVDLLCTRTTENSDSYKLFWGITLHIGYVLISFLQIQAKGSKVNKPGDNVSPKRMLHVSLSGFYAEVGSVLIDPRIS